MDIKKEQILFGKSILSVASKTYCSLRLTECNVVVSTGGACFNDLAFIFFLTYVIQCFCIPSYVPFYILIENDQ